MPKARKRRTSKLYSCEDLSLSNFDRSKIKQLVAFVKTKLNFTSCVEDMEGCDQLVLPLTHPLEVGLS